MITKSPKPHEIARQAREKGDLLRATVWSFIDDIEGAGGVVSDGRGNMMPAGDKSWTALGDRYLLACQAVGREPLVEKIDEDLEDSPRPEEPAP